MAKSQLMIITGVSGSGKSTALNAFEDLGYFCIDNLPAPLVKPFLDLVLSQGDSDTSLGFQGALSAAEAHGPRRYALLVDCRDEGAFPSVKQAIQTLREAGVEVSLLFFDCLDEVATRRFRETRRPHPLLLSGTLIKTVGEALAKERELLASFRAAATKIFDTSAFSPHDLRKAVEEYCGAKSRLEVIVESFGFKYGNPSDSDVVIDVRFLPNPHFVDELRPKTGLDKEVKDFVLREPDAKAFMEKYLELLQFLLPKYEQEGKRYLTVGIGCTGGKHRSVALTEAFADALKLQGYNVKLRHRDVGRA